MYLNKLKSNIQNKSRNNKLEQFYAEFPEPCKVLDVGILKIETHNKEKSANHFLKKFKFPYSYYTGLAIESMDGMEEAYPGSRFVTYDGRIFPFANDDFDILFSNAVIEHVGNFDSQLLFLNEMLRVSKNVFFTTPNKWFPVEVHTSVPLLHWSDDLFFKWCKASGKYYTKDNLNLLNYGKIKQLLALSNAVKWRIVPNKLMGLNMTYSIFCSKI